MSLYKLIPFFVLVLLAVQGFCQQPKPSKSKEYNPFERIGKKVKVVTLSNGKYDEYFDIDSIQRIGSILFDIYSKKIVGLLNLDSAYKVVSDNSSASRWMSVDPLAEKYSQWSPYVFAADNPIRYNDPDGKEFVDPNGKRVNIKYNKDGSLSFSKNATADIRRVANALNLTETGRQQLKGAITSETKVKVTISDEANIKKENGKTSTIYGETVQGNYNKSDDYGKKVNPDGTYGLKEATVTIYEGSIAEGVKAGSGLKHEGLTMEQAIGAVAGHELVHATDKVEINKDLKYQEKNNDNLRPTREVKPNQVERKIIDQSKKL